MQDQTILIYTGSRDKEHALQKLLGKPDFSVEVVTTADSIFNRFKLNETVVLLLCLSRLSDSVDAYEALMRDNSNINHSVHRAIVVCTENEAHEAARYCLDGRVDDYFVYHPMPDPGRIRLIVERSCAEVRSENELRNCTSYLAALKKQGSILDGFVEKHFKEAQEHINFSIESFGKVIELYNQDLNSSLEPLRNIDGGNDLGELTNLATRISKLNSVMLTNSVVELRKTLARNSSDWAEEAFKTYCRLSRKIHVPPSLVKNLASRKVLIVDDDELFRDIMVAMLEAGDYIALVAESGTEALELLRQTVPDVVVLDIDMPDMDGIELLRIIRANEAWDEVPVLMLTGLVDEETLATSIKAGANGFYAKPGNEIQGFETIDSLFRDEGPLQTRHKSPPIKALLTREQRETIRPLVIDDDAFMLEIIAALLTDLEVAEWQTARSGAAALRLLEESPDHFNVLILDLNMPEMDGIELLRHLAVKRYQGDIILISGYGSRLLSSVENLGSAHSLNLIGSLGKPITPFKLAEMLHKTNFDKISAPRAQEGAWEPSANEIREAIDNDEVILYYQPKYAIETKKLAGVEALARWSHPLRGIVSPVYFIPPAENYGLIAEMTYKLLKIAVEQYSTWKEAGHDIDISVNIAVSLLDDLEFPDYLSSLVSKAGMPFDKLTLEITETGLIKNRAHALDILNRLHLRGFKLSIDDFGTGDSSFVKLKQMPFDQLKIDREFTHGATEDKNAQAFVDASVVLGRELNLEVVAEGVENLDDWDFSKNAGCRFVQGYFMGYPMPPEDIIPWIQK